MSNRKNFWRDFLYWTRNVLSKIPRSRHNTDPDSDWSSVRGEEIINIIPADAPLNESQIQDSEDKGVPTNVSQNSIAEINVCTDAPQNEPHIQRSEDNVEPLGTQISTKPTHNIRALSKHARTYELETFKKNILIIFNQENIIGFLPRQGTEKDVEALKNTFMRFGFEVIVYKDLSFPKICCTLINFFKQDFTEYGCVGIAVLTYSTGSGELWAQNQLYNEAQVISCFNVHNKPTLVTKPKFLIIQASRKRQEIFSKLKIKSYDERKHLHNALYIIRHPQIYILPVDADLLILRSSYTGSPSNRDELYGSWFIQSLCNKIDQLAATHDVESIITEVKRDVAEDKKIEVYKRTVEMQENKRLPIMTTTLIRKLYLKKFGDLAPNVDDAAFSRLGRYNSF